MSVQLDVKWAVAFCVRYLVLCGKLVSGRIGGQAVCKKLLMAGEKFAVRNQKIVVRADAVISQRIEAVAKLTLDHDGVQPCRAEFVIEVSKLRRAHGLVQHLRDDLLLDGGEQRRVFRGGRRFAHGLEDDRQQLLLPRQRENGSQSTLSAVTSPSETAALAICRNCLSVAVRVMFVCQALSLCFSMA